MRLKRARAFADTQTRGSICFTAECWGTNVIERRREGRGIRRTRLDSLRAPSLLLASLLFGLLVRAPAHAQYALPSSHPRIFFTPVSFPAIADRCKTGGTHRAYYQAMLTSADSRIANGEYLSFDLPNYALVYRIHRHWNQTGYPGGPYEENKYWQAVRAAILNQGNWELNELGMQSAIAADWIWEKLTAAEVSQIAAYYGGPDPTTYLPQTWRDGTSMGIGTRTLRSTLFVGAGVNDAGYASEYQGILTYVNGSFALALQLQGGVGANGPMYENDFLYQPPRSWAIEAMRVASGVDPWPLCQKWASEYGKWDVYSTNPITGGMELQQDSKALQYSHDSPWNAVLLATRGQDRFGQSQVKDWWQSSQAWELVDYRRRALWCYVLWYDPNLPGYDAATEPLSARLAAGGMDQIYMRSSWTDPNYTLAGFGAGKYFYGHQHMSAGSFLISRKGYLALDSGIYAQYASSTGADHAVNYFTRSIAHNVVHIYDSAEKFWAPWDYNVPLVNDGGQCPPPTDPDYNDVLTLPEFSPGQMLRYGATSSYAYGQANLAGAYNSSRLMQRYNKPAYTNKIASYTREFVYLRPDFFVVIDRVNAKSAGLSKVWNLHVSGNPTINGTGVQTAGTATAGIWEHTGADQARVTDPSPAFGGGTLFVKSLMPKQRLIRKVGGDNRSPSGYAYWVGGINAQNRYDPTLGSNHHFGNWNPGSEGDEDNIPWTPLGWGRVEVQPTVDSAFDIFLHVLYPSDQSVQSMPETRLLESPNTVGAEIVNRRVVVFGRTETSNLDSLSYTLAANDTMGSHMVVNLTPGATYRVYKAGATYFVRKAALPGPPGALEIVAPPPAATQDGVLEFLLSGGALAIQVSNVVVQNKAQALGVEISWTTDRPSDSQVEFGTTTAYGQSSPLLPALVTSHAVTLSSPAISNDLTYQFRAVSQAPGGYFGASSNLQLSGDWIAPARVNDLLIR